MKFPQDPIEFIDNMVDLHKVRLKKRKITGESLKYMREAVDQQGLGGEFMKFWVHNPNPKISNPEDDNTDLSLLQLYEHWREKYNMRPIEAWDGTTLRPWLPPESNPQVPEVLKGDLSDLLDAYTRFPPPEGSYWHRLDVLGNIVESYLNSIRRHSVWSRPIGGGKLRLYRLNGLNNIETAPYSILFWGFLKWADNLRKKLFNEPIEEYPHDEWSDIAFMHKFNQMHFAWHDDVFGKGKCPNWQDQLGRMQRHKYPMPTQGYAMEFLEFHSDVIKAYNRWLKKMGRLPTRAWMSGKHNTAYILKYAFGGPWGRGGTNGQALDPKEWASELMDEELSSFKTAAELGSYLERCGINYHGIGHVENCDIRDVYTNNYSIRFFAWHQWIDDLYHKILTQGKPMYDPKIPLDKPIPNLCDNVITPKLNPPFTGTWTYRSYHNDPDPNADVTWFVAEMRIVQSGDKISGILDSGHPDYQYKLQGYLDEKNVHYEQRPEWWDDRMILVMTAKGMTEATKGHVYEYRGHLVPKWINGKNQVPAFVGSISRSKRPDDPTKEGKIGSFITVFKTMEEKDLVSTDFQASLVR